MAFLHTDQGPGIRRLIEGRFRVQTEGRTIEVAPLGAWFESGPAPVCAEAAADCDRPKSQRDTVFVDRVLNR